jgi:hypothetical protein
LQAFIVEAEVAEGVVDTLFMTTADGMFLRQETECFVWAAKPAGIMEMERRS